MKKNYNHLPGTCSSFLVAKFPGHLKYMWYVIPVEIRYEYRAKQSWIQGQTGVGLPRRRGNNVETSFEDFHFILFRAGENCSSYVMHNLSHPLSPSLHLSASCPTATDFQSWKRRFRSTSVQRRNPLMTNVFTWNFCSAIPMTRRSLLCDTANFIGAVLLSSSSSDSCHSFPIFYWFSSPWHPLSMIQALPPQEGSATYFISCRLTSPSFHLYSTSSIWNPEPLSSK